VRVLHVIDSLAPGGGAESRFVEELLRFSTTEGHLVVHLFERDQLAAPLRAAGIPVQGLGLRASSGGRTFPIAAVRLARAIREHRADVVHTSLYHADLAGQLAGWMTGVPVVSSFVKTGDASLNGIRTGGRGGSRKAAVLDAVTGWVARTTHARYRAVSRDAAQTYAAELGLDPAVVRVIPRGVATDRFDVAPDRARFGLPDGRPLIVNVARHEPMKGHVALLEAFAAVRRRVPGAVLAVAGSEGSTTAAIHEAMARLDLDGSVHLLGLRPDVPQLLASADAFAFPSSAEGMPGAVLEALLAGLPVAAFDIPPVREVTDDGRRAHLVPIGDVAGLADALVDALGEGRRPTGDDARWVRDRFDATATGAAVESYLGEVAANGGDRATRDGGPLRTGTLVISIDTELQWGSLHRGEFGDRTDAAAERRAVERTLAVLDRHGIAATWALVGHLFLRECAPDPVTGVKHPEVVRPDYDWFDGDWFDRDPCSDLVRDPEWYGADLVDAIRTCPTRQELASHSFAHMIAGDPGTSVATFRSDLAECRRVAALAGLDVRTLVYPRNTIGHVDELAGAGFTAYRGLPSRGRPRPGWRARAARLTGRVLLTRASTAQPRPEHGVWNIPGTFLFNPADRDHLGPWLWQARRRLRQGARHGTLVHLWFHPQNISQDLDVGERALDDLLREARRLLDLGRLENLTMAELADRLGPPGARPGPEAPVAAAAPAGR
jgi:glycosyltransferase involved in cell wall biosynthesis/peptidoglycan/xylan/chitin deacetylase (PgdA/CDA1 family)